MIVVDTSVWIDFFRDRDEPHVAELVMLIEEDAGVALTDVILTEILQGVPSNREANRVEKHLRAFDVLRLHELEDFTRAARLYRQARTKGVTIRRTLDCLTASVCIRDQAPILHNDADFDRLASASPLLVHQPRSLA